jgi:hypothetical protein
MTYAKSKLESTCDCFYRYSELTGIAFVLFLLILLLWNFVVKNVDDFSCLDTKLCSFLCKTVSVTEPINCQQFNTNAY